MFQLQRPSLACSSGPRVHAEAPARPSSMHLVTATRCLGRSHPLHAASIANPAASSTNARTRNLLWHLDKHSPLTCGSTHTKGSTPTPLALTPHRFVCTLSNLSRTPRRPTEISFRPNRQSIGFDKYRGCHSTCLWLKQLVAAVHPSVIYLPSYASPLGAARSTRRIQPSSCVVFPIRIWLPCPSLTASASQPSTVLGPVFVAP
jgi:hypothetical protein